MLLWISAREYAARLPKALWLVVWAAFVVALLPLLWQTGGALGALLGVAVALKGVALWQGKMAIAWAGMALALPLGVWLVYADFPRMGFTLSFLNLFALMAVAKLLEARNARDARVLFLLELLLMLAFLMHSQSILMFVYLLLALGVAVWALLKTEQRGAPLAFGRWRDVAKLLGIALPFAVVMFFLFPRIPPLWGIPHQQQNAVTGLPEEMRMGDLSSLATSNEVAFRVRFEGDVPASRLLYWRGPVLWHYDGENWQQRIRDESRPPVEVKVRRDALVRYAVVPEKRDLQWLLTLDVVTDAPLDTRIGYAMQVRMPPQKGAARYQLTSATDYRLLALDERDRADALRLPENFDAPRTRALAREMFAAGGGTAGGFAQAFMRFLHTEEFYYSLEPPPGMGDVDEFLFRGRIGFCEHYANAMTLAARMAGIPARVVIGYQGGEVNPLNGEVVVREELAHAWVELYDATQGWTRYDPTAAVAPNRVEQARLSASVLSAGEDSRSFTSRMAEKLEALAWLRNALDATQSFWRNWVIDLDGSQQGNLLGKLGLASLGRAGLMLALFAGLLGLALLLAWWWKKRPREDQDALARAALTMLRRFERAGHVRYSHESVAMFLRRMAEARTGRERDSLLRAAQAYDNVRYRGRGNAEQSIGFIKRLRAR
ncbi:MAG: transglutaminaseTgpA domain-containing protein [Cardiobacteriaceae bacterium]|nr:transglutaminaseTgpA domain-containing protein [Cardiobacteriaceae bacterium]